SRIVVERPLAAPFIAALKAAAEAIFLGDLRDERSGYGPLINQRAVDKVLAHVRQAVAAGAELVTGGDIVAGL
ncbi:MAG: aldehyde dehydrogenase family protein, partial [Halioglobus sp.]|nr:aldehyde dehydrogenase family protein [Halioglobus sp.]